MKIKILSISICMLFILSVLSSIGAVDLKNGNEGFGDYLITSSNTAWPQFQNNNELTGYTSETGNIVVPDVKWSYTTNEMIWLHSSPVIGNVLGGSENEIVAGDDAGWVYCLNGFGTLMWDTKLIDPDGDDDMIESVPVICNIDGGAAIEVIVSSWEGYIYCLNGNDGSIKWTSDFLQNCVDSSPNIADIDNDGVLEILVASYANRLYCVDGLTGHIDWYAGLNGDPGSPAIANIDGGSDIEIVVCGGKCVTCIDGDDGSEKWEYNTWSDMDRSSPTIANVDNSGNPEVIFGHSNGKVYCMNSDGSVKWECSGLEPIRCSPAVANLDGDSKLEIVVGGYGGNYRNLFCIDGGGTLQWRCPDDASYNFDYSSPAICDIDSDGTKEIIITSNEDLCCFNGNTGVREWKVTVTSGWTDSSPAIGDIDYDENVEIVVGCEESPGGKIVCVDKAVPSLINFYTDPSNKGSITFDGSNYNHGDSTQKYDGEYSASANPNANYNFDHWSTTGGISVSNANSASTSVTVNDEGSLKAHFNYNPPTRTIDFYTDPSNGGSITFDGNSYSNGQSTQKGDGSYFADANPASYYSFDCWSATGGISVSNSNSASTTVTVSGDGSLTAHFVYSPPQRTITFSTNPNNGGTITFDGDSFSNGDDTNKPDGTYSISANPAYNHEFDYWSTTGGITVADPNSVSTTATISGSAGTVTAHFNEPQAVDWTAIVYLCGSDLGTWVNTIANFIDNVNGAGTDVHIVVLLDEPGNANTNAFFVSNTPGRTAIPLSDINGAWANELDLSDPQILIDFSEFCIEFFPANHYLIVPTNHGGSWVGCCWDDVSSNNLDIDDLEVAFSTISNQIGRNVDVVFFNDCLMNGIEIAYQLHPFVDYQVGSETVSYTWSCDNEMETILQHMINNPTISSLDLSNYITAQQSIFNNNPARAQCISTVDLDRIQDLTSLIDTLALDLQGKLSNTNFRNQIVRARNQCEYTMGPYSGQIERIIDLFDFAQNIVNEVNDANTQNIAQNILDNIGTAGGQPGHSVTNERHTNAANFCHGISIYFPDRSFRFDGDYTVGNEFTSDTNWDEFLSDFLNPTINPEGFGWDAYIKASSDDLETYGESFSFGEDENATDGYDDNYDVYFTGSSSDIEIYSKNDNSKYSVDIKYGESLSKNWDVFIEWKGSGTIDIDLEWDILNIPVDEYVYVFLYDSALQQEVNMRTGDSYTFSISSNNIRQFEIRCYKSEQLIADAGGPYSGEVDDDISIAGTASGGTSPYVYSWDLDNDGEFDDATDSSVIYSWDTAGTKIIKLKVLDDDGVSAIDESEVEVSEANSAPNKPNKPAKDEGYIKSSATDPEGHNIFYLIDWGDNSDSGWLGPYESGQEVKEKHSYGKNGKYYVKIKAKDDPDGDGDTSDGKESVWSESLEVEIKSRGKFVDNPIYEFIQRLIQRFPIIKTVLQKLQILKNMFS